jgi:DNA processing protein
MKHARSLLIVLRAVGATAAARHLLERHGDADAALAAGADAWREAGIAAADWPALTRPDHARLDADLAWLSKDGHHLVGWDGGDYPALLRRIASPPLALFVAGDPTLLWHPQVAIVGSRRPSAGGRDHARQFARALAGHGLAITSGLAEGVDTEAHCGALSVGRTVAVIATGPDLVYPAGNRDLMRRIAVEGAVVSEHPPGTPPRPAQFPSRNRLIAGLALGTVVVEAALRSGALITARLAAEAGREVFALPGSIDNPMARGCHRLIRQGAALIETPDEILETLAPVAADLAEALRGRLAGSGAGPGIERPPDAATPSAGGPQQQLWLALGHDPSTADQLAHRTGLTVATLSAMLTAMELDGRVTAEHGRYARRP